LDTRSTSEEWSLLTLEAYSLVTSIKVSWISTSSERSMKIFDVTVVCAEVLVAKVLMSTDPWVQSCNVAHWIMNVFLISRK
jgi:hypothetical protein